MIQETAGSVFALHVDESTHLGKVRLEYWIVHHVEGTRKVRYLVTKELKTDFDASVCVFLTNTGCRDLNEMKLFSAEAVFNATMQALNAFSLDQMKLIHAINHESACDFPGV